MPAVSGNRNAIVRSVPPALFWNHVQPASGCWLWTGYRRPDGAPLFTLQSRYANPTRVAYFLAYNALDSSRIYHTCHTPSCVRPDHLSPLVPPPFLDAPHLSSLSPVLWGPQHWTVFSYLALRAAAYDGNPEWQRLRHHPARHEPPPEAQPGPAHRAPTTLRWGLRIAPHDDLDIIADFLTFNLFTRGLPYPHPTPPLHLTPTGLQLYALTKKALKSGATGATLTETLLPSLLTLLPHTPPGLQPPHPFRLLTPETHS